MFMGRAYHKNWRLCKLGTDASLVSMSKETTLDDTPGFPEVPEGYFWRVSWNQDNDSVWIRVSVSLEMEHPGGEEGARFFLCPT